MADALAHLLSWQAQQVGVIIYLLVIQANTLLNARNVRRLAVSPEPTVWPRVAILVPARNEEATIAACIDSLAGQRYPELSIWALDDQSTDATAAILSRAAARFPCLRVLSGKLLPEGWLGKSWACQQLAEAADADLLLFVDSDTWHHPLLLHDAVVTLLAQNLDLLSIVPREIMLTTAERLTTPLIPWSLLTHFPLALAQRLGWQRGAAALGQTLLIRCDAYLALGGHAAVRGEVAEDLALARKAAAAHLRWRLADGSARSFCRMYRSVAAVREGFGKNLTAPFGRRLWLFALAWIWLTLAFVSPPLLLIGALIMRLPISIPLALAGTLLATGAWVTTALRFRLPLLLVVVYPVTMLVWLLLVGEALYQAMSKRATWKGRGIALKPE